MLIRHLSFFVTLAQERHFKKAAEICNVAQPTLSAAIQNLEEDLGATLIVRGHRYLGLTPEGEKALAWGRQILADYDNLRDELHGTLKGLTGTLRLGVIPAAMPSVSFLTERFCARHPKVQVEIRSMTTMIKNRDPQKSGGQLFKEVKRCDGCSNGLDDGDGWNFCPFCGDDLGAPP